MKNKIILTVLVLLTIPTLAYAKIANRITAPPAGNMKTTPDANIFNLADDSQRFVLLDSDDEGFFVASLKYAGRYVFDPDDELEFNPNDTNNIAYRLNNEYLENGFDGNGNTLPAKIKQHLVTRKWPTESGNTTVDYVYPECKVALLSVEEYVKYLSVLGSYDDNSWWGWYTRSPAGNTPTKTGLAVAGESSGTVIYVDAHIACGIRPVFYIDKDFFKDVKLNMNTIGDKVRKSMRDNYTKSELSAIYNSGELSQIFSEIPPEAYDIWTIGYNNVGDTMTAYYKYRSPEGKPENGTTYRWVRADEIGGTTSVIKGATGMTYTLQEEDAGKYVFFEVTPASATSVGSSYLSKTEKGRIVKAAYKPEARDVHIWGQPCLGETLEAVYLYYDENREIEEGTTFQWQRETGGIFADIDNASGKRYTISAHDIGHKIRCVIVPKNEGYYNENHKGERNNCKYNIGDPVYSEATETIVALPEARNVSVNNKSLQSYLDLRDNKLLFSLVKEVENGAGKRFCINYDYYDFLNISEGKSEYVWEICNKPDGEFVRLEDAGLDEYVISQGNTALYIRCGVIPVNKNGVRGKISYSKPIMTGGEAYAYSTNGVSGVSANVRENTNLTLYAKRIKNPYAVSFKLTCSSGITIENITSDGYYVILNRDGDVYNCLLIKTGTLLVESGDASLAEILVNTSKAGTVTVSDFASGGIGFLGKAEDNSSLPEMLELQ